MTDLATKEVSGPMATPAHGPGGLFSNPALGGRSKREEKAKDSHAPPEGVRVAAQRGLDLRRQFGRGGTAVGIARARDLSNGKSVSDSTIKRMRSFFARHAVDKRAGWSNPDDPSNGYIAHMLWGGDAGKAWADKIVRSIDAETTTKPFASQAQQRFAFATGQPWAEEWAKHTDFGDLPRRARKRKSKSAQRRMSLKAPNYGARAGETITGNLGRGAGGQFVSAGNAGSNPKLFGTSEEDKKRAEADKKRKKRDQTADSLAGQVGLSAGELNTLRQAAEGGAVDDAKLETLGLLDEGEMTPTGRRALSALERGDTRAYAAALQVAKRRLERKRAQGDRVRAREDAKRQRAADKPKKDKPEKPDKPNKADERRAATEARRQEREAQREARADVARRLEIARAQERNVDRQVRERLAEINALNRRNQTAMRQSRSRQARARARREAEQKRATKTLLALELELLRLKHGKHDQSTHGKKGRAGQAGGAAYAAARAGGSSHQEALGAAKEATAQERAAMRAEAAQRRSERLQTQAGRTRRAANSGEVTDAQRAALLDKADRLEARARGEKPQPKAKLASGLGDETKAYGTDPNQSYTLQHKVVDMADLKASNLANGAINPAYDPALQPRDRSRAASQAQIDAVARNLNSDVLVTDFHRIDSGSPILDKNGNVLSGNGRTLALQRAAEMNPAQYAAYKEKLKADAARLGIDPKAIDGMQNPVLVRELKGDTDPIAFAREANSSGTLRMSPLEQAKVDAATLRDQSVMRLGVREGQGIDQALRDPGNKPFINEFLSTVPDNERATLLTRNGELNQMGLYRAKAALYTKAFQGESGSRLAESMLESLDPDVKTIQTGISSSLPGISRATSLIRSGDRDKSLDLSEDFARTIDVYARIKDNPALTANTPANRLIDKYLSQSQMFDRELTPDQEVLLRYIDSISRKPTAVRDMFNSWADIVEKQPPPGQSSLFGDGPMTRQQLIAAIIGGDTGSTSQGGLFD